MGFENGKENFRESIVIKINTCGKRDRKETCIFKRK